jgi:hypothetical protein
VRFGVGGELAGEGFFEGDVPALKALADARAADGALAPGFELAALGGG